MSLATMKTLVLTALICLLLFQVGSWISAVAGALWGASAAVIVAGVSFVCARLARRGGQVTFWFLLPTVLFTVVPVLVHLWSAWQGQATLLSLCMDLTPLLLGFVCPVALLAIVYLDLRNKT